MARRLNVEIRVRCTIEDRTRWHRLAEECGLSLSALMRRALGHVRPWSPGRVDLERERIRELSRIGNNLNQLARWANTHKGALDAVVVLSRLEELAETLAALRSEDPEAEEAAP